MRTFPLKESLPDGIYGSNTHKHLLRWKSADKKASWILTEDGQKGLVDRWEDARGTNNTASLDGTEYLNWLNYLTKIKKHYQIHPNSMIEKVNEFRGDTDTLKVQDWDFGIDHIHLLGIRRDPERGKGRGSDDVILLLIKGMVFKFQGSTDPGMTKHEDGASVPGTGTTQLSIWLASAIVPGPASSRPWRIGSPLQRL